MRIHASPRGSRHSIACLVEFPRYDRKLKTEAEDTQNNNQRHDSTKPPYKFLKYSVKLHTRFMNFGSVRLPLMNSMNGSPDKSTVRYREHTQRPMKTVNDTMMVQPSRCSLLSHSPKNLQHYFMSQKREKQESMLPRVIHKQQRRVIDISERHISQPKRRRHARGTFLTSSNSLVKITSEINPKVNRRESSKLNKIVVQDIKPWEIDLQDKQKSEI